MKTLFAAGFRCIRRFEDFEVSTERKLVVSTFVEDEFGEVGGVDTGFRRKIQGELLAAVRVTRSSPLGIAKIHGRRCRGPELDFADVRVAIDLQAMRLVGAVKIPFQLRQRLARHHTAVEGIEAGDQAGTVFQAVAVVGNVNEVFVAFQIIPIEVARFERPVAVVRAKHDEFGLREAIAIFPRIDDLAESETAGRVDLLIKAFVVVDLFG